MDGHGENLAAGELPAGRAGHGPEAFLHLEAHGGVVAPPAGQAQQVGPVGKPLVNEHARRAAGTGVEVLVGAPTGKIHVPVVQVQLDVAGRVGQVEPHQRAHRVARFGNGGHVEHLAGVVVDAAHENGGQRVAQLRDFGFDVFGAQAVFAGARQQLHDDFGGVEAVQVGLALDGVLVGGKSAAFHQNLVARARGAVKRDQQQVQVHGKSVHHHHFQRRGPHHAGGGGGQGFVVVHPGRGAVEMTFYALPLPTLELMFGGGTGGLGLQAQRVAAEVGAGLPVGAGRDVEFGAKRRQRVLSIELGSSGKGGRSSHSGKGRGKAGADANKRLWP